MMTIKNKHGFTLIELICTVTIICLLTGTAVGLFKRSLARWELETTAWKMAVDIRRWQQRAIAEQKYGLKMTVIQSERKYLLKENITIKEIKDISSTVKNINISPASFATVEFYPTGITSAAGTYALENYYGDFRYVIILNTTGRVRVSKSAP